MKELSELISILHTDTLGTILEEALQVVPSMGDSRLTEKLHDIQRDYDLMKHFMLIGGNDNQRGNMYAKLKKRLFNILCNARLLELSKTNKTLSSLKASMQFYPFEIGNLRNTLESYVGELAMAGLDADSEKMEKTVYGRWHELRKAYFSAIIIGGNLSDSNREQIIEVLGLPTIDQIDKEIIISALMLSLQFVYDDNKYLCLLRAFKQCKNEKLHAHLLIALALTLPEDSLIYTLFPDTISETQLIFSEDDVKKELLELQMQLSLCNQVDEVDKTLTSDIIPTIMKHQNPNDILKDDTIEGSSLDEILKPNTSEESINELEETIGRMDDMQKSGLDIYFGGFSKMKRDGFFYTLVNWFYPFTVYHPQLSHLPSEVLHGGIMKMIVEGAPLCDSDMYSMALGVNQVYNMLPQKFKEMFGSQEIKIRESFDRNTPAYYRRTYLQNLLRFYRLYTSKQDFHNPFYTSNDKEEEWEKGWFFMYNPLFTESGLFTDELVSLSKYFFKKGKYDLCWTLINSFHDHNTTDAQKKVLMLINGLANYEKGYLQDAAADLLDVLEIEPNNTVALKYYVIVCLAHSQYQDAIDYAQRLHELKPDDEEAYRYSLITQIGVGKTEDASKELFRLYYENPEEIEVQRNMAWAYLHLEKPEKAVELFDKLIEGNDRNWTTLVNAIYAYVFTGQIQKVKAIYPTLMEVMKDQDLNEKSEIVDILMLEDRLLNIYNYNKVDFEVVLDCC